MSPSPFQAIPLPNDASRISEKHWEDLLYAFRRGNCVVLTGSNFASKEVGNVTRPMTEWLALQLAAKLEADGHALDESEKLNLYYTATEYLKLKGDTNLQKEVEEFYAAQSRHISPLHELLVKLPISLVINTGPDYLLERAFKQAFKNVRSGWYCLNRDTDKEQFALEMEEPTPDNPLIYNLLGSAKDPESLVLTEKDQLRFLEDVIQHNNAIPNAVLNKLGEKKFYLFLGFDFERWQFRILLRMLRLSDAHLAPVLAPVAVGPSHSAMIFFQKQYKLEFPLLDSAAFLQEFGQRWEAYETSLQEEENTAPIEVFYLFHEADAGQKEALDKHLAVLRSNQAIRTWDESKIFVGDEVNEQITAKLQNANMILLLVSADSLASQRIYDEQLQTALERHRKRQAVVCPILLRACSWEGASFSRLPTILPRNKKPLLNWSSPDEAYRHVAKELEGFVEILIENL